jgi:outer membrane protein assembly factor BamB
MWFRYNKALLGKVLLLFLMVMLLVIVGGLTGLGCIKGQQSLGWSGGVVADGTLFVGSKEGRLVRINIADGARQWSDPLTDSGSAGGFGCLGPAGGGCAAASGVAIYGTPAVAGGLVYIGGYNGRIYAYDSTSLEIRWVYPRESYLESIIGGLVVAQGKVFFGCSDGRVYALDAETGNKEWEPFETGDKIWSTPAVSGDTVYIGSFDKKLYALNAADGSKRWEFETEGAIAATPLVYNNMVYIGSFDRHLYTVDATTGKQIWQFPATDEGENKPGNWFWAKPVVHNSIIYAANLDGKIYILNAESGDEIVDAIDLGGPLSASPVVVNSSLIFASQQGVIYALDTGSKELRQLADIEKDVYGPLSASGGVAYIHTQDLTLHPVDANSGAKLPTISLKSSE